MVPSPSPRANIITLSSFKDKESDNDNVVSLAIAFETLLIDFYSPGVTDKILYRAKILLKGIPGNRKMNAEISNLIKKRGATVHLGSSSLAVDLSLTQKAYANILLKIIQNVENINPTNQEPILELINDIDKNS